VLTVPPPTPGSDGLNESSEAIGILDLRSGANLLPALFASEVLPDQ
jgi:hypothetical protein